MLNNILKQHCAVYNKKMESSKKSLKPQLIYTFRDSDVDLRYRKFLSFVLNFIYFLVTNYAHRI